MLSTTDHNFELRGERFKLNFRPQSLRDIWEMEPDPVVTTLASGNPEFLARLICLDGLRNLEGGEDAKLHKLATFTLFCTLTDAEPGTIDAVAEWTNPDAHPPLAADFTYSELWWIANNRRASRFVDLVTNFVPGYSEFPNPENRPSVIVETNGHL